MYIDNEISFLLFIKPGSFLNNQNQIIQTNIILQTLACIDGLKKVHNSNQKAKNQGSLFDEGERILLQVTGIKLPKDDRKQFLRM